MKKLNGNIVSKTLSDKIKDFVDSYGKKIILSIFQIGDNQSSNKYIKFKIKKADDLGITTKYIKLRKNVSEKELINLINIESSLADGIIVQLPLPNHLNKDKILDSVPIEKDVDGLSSFNNKIIPATPKGILELLNYYNINMSGKIVAVVGQSNLVGKPISILCERHAKKVIRLDQTTGLNGTEKADILIVAAGVKNLIKKENIKKGVIIIDVGINTLSNKKIVGDVDLISVGNIPYAISPVPGGVGPMTVISLFSNLIDIIKNKGSVDYFV